MNLIASMLKRSATLCVAFFASIIIGGATTAAPPNEATQLRTLVAAPPVERAPVIRRVTPVLRPDIVASLSGSDFRLQFKDAYLVYQPPSGPGAGVLQIVAELNVLSYGGDWTVAKLQPYLYHLKLNSWSGFFWKVNTSRHEIYKVTGGTFGSLGGSESAVPNVTVDTVGDPNNPDRFFLRFADSYLIKPHASAHPQIVASNTVLSYGADWTITQDSARAWVYHLSESVWKGFSWKANLLRQRAYRVTDPLNPCGADVLLKADVYAPASVTGGTNDYDVFGCTWAAVARPEGVSYPDTSPLADLPDDEVIGKDVATATSPAAMTRVTIRDAATSAVLASTPATMYLGDYDIRFTNPAATKNVVFEVSRLDTGDAIYTSPSLPLSHGDNPRDILLIGAETGVISGIPFPPGTNTGLFTRVGNVELADIDPQGFAKFASAAPQWRDAPFGGRLDLFGAFTSNFYPNTGVGNYCYKMRVQPPSGPAYYMSDPVYKTRYVVKSDGHVQSQSIFIGPQTIGVVNGCYRLTPLSSAPEPGDPPGTVAVFWSYPDLLGRWHTDSRNDLYHVTLEMYQKTSTTKLPILVNDNTTAELYLDNTPVDISFDQLTVSGGGPNLLVDQCAIANLMNGKTLMVDFTAYQSTGFLASYGLSARSNSGVTVWSEGGTYAAPAWGGSRPPVYAGRATAAPPFVKTAADFSAGPCAYVLDLHARARTTDGYSHINWRHQQKFYYIQP
ncbi:MAG TPA: hypothetical protein VNH64_09490 [Parvularculaceae bacterium]|nr:hypothetical protein [Parvularculaceae bacterium]